jgi:RHS repeat-associated protein
VKDALGASHTTNFTYDGFDRLSRTTFPDTTYEELTYDANGNVASRRNRSAQVLTFTYDNLDRMKTKVSPSPSVTATWAYLSNGLIDSISDTAGHAIDYGYDTAGRLTTAATTIAGLTGAKTISYGLDANGNRTSLTWPESGAQAYSVAYTYDTLNRMATAVNGATTLATYTYNPLSQRTNLAYNNSGGATVAYTWSIAGDLTSLTHNLTNTSPNYDVTYTLAYTPAHQLSSSTISNTAYQYNLATTGTDAYAAANTLNQYPSVTKAGQAAQTLTYDTRGNLTGDGVWTYGYDAENRMLTAVSATVNASFQYDPLGRRTKKSTGATASKNTFYLSDGDNEIAEYNGNGVLLRRYVPGPAIDDPIAMVTSAGVTTYFHEDKTGSVVAMSGATGARTEGAYLYDAFGNVSDATGVPFKFTGRRLDSEIGLYYYRARYYSSALGRFLQTDPVGYSAGMNLYAYVGNDPTDRNDPLGLYSCGSGLSANQCGEFTNAQEKAKQQISSAIKDIKTLKSALSSGKLSDQDKAVAATISKYLGKDEGKNQQVLDKLTGAGSKMLNVLNSDKPANYYGNQSSDRARAMPSELQIFSNFFRAPHPDQVLAHESHHDAFRWPQSCDCGVDFRGANGKTYSLSPYGMSNAVTRTTLIQDPNVLITNPDATTYALGFLGDQ